MNFKCVIVYRKMSMQNYVNMIAIILTWAVLMMAMNRMKEYAILK